MSGRKESAGGRRATERKAARLSALLYKETTKIYLPFGIKLFPKHFMNAFRTRAIEQLRQRKNYHRLRFLTGPTWQRVKFILKVYREYSSNHLTLFIWPRGAALLNFQNILQNQHIKKISTLWYIFCRYSMQLWCLDNL